MSITASDDAAPWRRLDWNDVRTFLAVAEAGSLNGAAAALGMTQPTISRRMEDLEIRLAVRLFDRSSRGVALTQAGHMMRELAAGMARFGGSIVRDVAGRDRVDMGRVQIAVPDGLATFILTPAVAEFQQTDPQIELCFDCGLWPEQAFANGADITLDFASVGPSDVVSTPLARLHYALYASSDYLNTYGAPKTLPEVAAHRFVRHTILREQRETWHPKADAVSELAGRHLVTNSSAASLMAVRCGAGIGSLPTASYVFAPELVMLDFEPTGQPVLWLRHHAAAARQGRIKRVIEWIQRVFDPSEQPWFREEFIHPCEFEAFILRARQPSHRAARAQLATG